MDSQTASSREYQDFEPTTSIVQEEDCDTIIIYVPGFRKDQLRVQLTKTRTLEISGARHTRYNKWIRFQKEFPVSTNCDTGKITAKFELKEHDAGILYIRQPKLITSAVTKDEEKMENKAQILEKIETKPPQPQPTEMKDASYQNDETKSSEKMEDGDKVGDVAQKSEDEEKEAAKKGGLENDENGKIKKDYGFQSGELVMGRIKITKKVGRVITVILVFLVVGIYVKNLIMPEEKYELAIVQNMEY